MTTPIDAMRAAERSSAMTPERWRIVDAIVRAALACEPDERAAFIADACGADDALRHEVESLFAHDAHDDFLERPFMETFSDTFAAPLDAGVPAPTPLARRLAAALAGRYVIEREIARGGMASVHLARDVRHDRLVAIKVLRDEVARTVGAERFLAEIRVTASLQHPNILPLFDSGSADGLLWYAMPFVDGGTLRARLEREGRLPVDEAVRLAREVSDALDHAHTRGVVHRDIKPENVLLRGGHALVADFGIALALEQSGGERLTRTGLTLGTPQYMAPEQASGERVLDARVDVYALGAVLHEMLAGEPPRSWSTPAVARRAGDDAPTPLLARRPDVAPPLDAAVRRALARSADDRFASAASFSAALTMLPNEGHAIHDVGDRGVPSHQGGVGTRRRTVGASAALYVSIAALAAGLIGGWALSRTSVTPAWWARGGPAPQGPQIPQQVITAPVIEGDASLVIVDRWGRPQRSIEAARPWTPRFSPDGRRIAFGAFGPGRTSSDIYVADLQSGATKRLTDDDGDGNDPQWAADGKRIAYSVNAPGGKDIAMLIFGRGERAVVATRDGTQFPSDWLRDGSAIIVTEEKGEDRGDILVQPVDGSPARPFAATSADESAARVSSDGRWIAYTSDESGRAEVYLDSFTSPGRRVLLSQGGGIHPVWRADGRELYYWREDALIAVSLGPAKGDAPPLIEATKELFRAPYQSSINTMYDVSPDGQRFVIVRRR